MPRIRPLAIVVFRKGDRLLLMDCFDSVKREKFYRPPRQHIEVMIEKGLTIPQNEKLVHVEELTVGNP